MRSTPSSDEKPVAIALERLKRGVDVHARDVMNADPCAGGSGWGELGYFTCMMYRGFLSQNLCPVCAAKDSLHCTNDMRGHR